MRRTTRSRWRLKSEGNSDKYSAINLTRSSPHGAMTLMTDPPDKSNKLKAELQERLWQAINYLSIFIFIIIVYSGFFFTEYILLKEVSYFLSDEVTEFPLVKLWFDNARIGLAFLVMVVAVVHGILATWSQIKIDFNLK
jgi:hypothetical protein